MIKRILSVALAMALLLTALPFVAQEAKAASDFKASPELIEVIKGWEGFCSKPVWDYGQWSVGYGTRAPDEHLERYRTEGISEAEATELLNMYMDTMGRSVNSFIDKYGLTVNQGQFDAMLSLTYNCGSLWLLEPSTLRTSVIENWSGSDLLFAFGQWSSAGGSMLPGLARRRMAEANMFLNAQYSVAPPDHYGYVTYDPNGGQTTVTIQAYDSTQDVAIRAVASYENYIFEGWYTDPTGGEKVEILDETVQGYTLYAHWRAGEGVGLPQETPNTTITGNPVSYVKEVSALTLNAFDQPVKGALVVDAFAQYSLVDIVAEYTDSTGVKWGKVQNVGWINLAYTQDPSDDSAEGGVTVKVTAVDVNVRRGPGTTYAAVGKVTLGDQLVITRTTTGGGYTWGKFDRGWIALKYTNYDDAVNGNISSGETNQKPVMGTVKVEEFLRIRSNAGVANAVVGYLGPNDRVEILERKAVGGTIWGRITQGWISLDYVVLDTNQTQAPEQTPAPEQKPEQSQPEQTPTPEQKPEVEKNPAVTGKVKLTSGRLNIRSGPSTGYTVVGTYNNGTAVTILEQKTVGTMVWGKTDKGWISMDYVKLDEQAKEEETQPEQSQPETKPEQTPAPEQKPEQTPTPETGTVTGKVTLTSGTLRIRSGPGTNNGIVGYLVNGTQVTITEKRTVGTTVWGKMDKGWISMDYVKLSTQEQTPAHSVTGTINVNDFLRIRSGAGTNHAIVGYYYKNNKVTITEQKTIYGTVWGKTDKGWISLDYVILDGQNSNTSTGGNTTTGSTTTTQPEQSTTQTGTVKLTSGRLRIRSSAGTNHAIVGSLANGEKVTITETTTVNGTKWGKIANGWISMDYVVLN